MFNLLKLVTICLCLVTGTLFAGEHEMIDVLGTSPKGQYVAVEEYGYNLQTHSYHVSVKVVNVWTKEYVGNEIKVVLPAVRPDYLMKARAEAKLKASDELKRFNISV